MNFIELVGMWTFSCVAPIATMAAIKKYRQGGFRWARFDVIDDANPSNHSDNEQAQREDQLKHGKGDDYEALSLSTHMSKSAARNTVKGIEQKALIKLKHDLNKARSNGRYSRILTGLDRLHEIVVEELNRRRYVSGDILAAQMLKAALKRTIEAKTLPGENDSPTDTEQEEDDGAEISAAQGPLQMRLSSSS